CQIRPVIASEAKQSMLPLGAKWIASSRSLLAMTDESIIQLVEVANRLHDRLEIGARIERIEELGGVRQQGVRALDRDPHVLLRRVGKPAVARQQDPRVQLLQLLQRLDVVGDRARAEHAAHHAAGHQCVGGKQQPLLGVEQRHAGRGVAGRIEHVEVEIAEVDHVALFEPDVDVDRHVRLVEHLAQHREVVAQHDLVGGEAVRGDVGSSLEMIGRADMVEMLVGEHHHVDLLRLDADMIEAGEEVRVVGRKADIDHDGALGADHDIGVGGTVLEAHLIDVGCGLDQGRNLDIEQGLERRRAAVTHMLPAVLKVRSLETRRRLLSASMIISAKAGCWLTRYTKRAWLIRITRVSAEAAMAVAERDEPSITAISPKNSPLPSVTMTVLRSPLTFAISTSPSSTTKSSRPVEPSSKMTSPTPYSFMHFSMAMPVPDLIPADHVSREMTPRKRQLRCPLARYRRAASGCPPVPCPSGAAIRTKKRPLKVPKISVRAVGQGLPVTNWQAMKVTKWSIHSGELQRERTTG